MCGIVRAGADNSLFRVSRFFAVRAFRMTVCGYVAMPAGRDAGGPAGWKPALPKGGDGRRLRVALARSSPRRRVLVKTLRAASRPPDWFDA